MKYATFIAMEDYAAKPIPNLDALRELKRRYRAWEIDMTAPENAEALVDVRTLGIAGTNHYFSSTNPPYHQHIPGSIEELLVREGVGAKLVAINRELQEKGMELFVFDALRPLAIQNYFHDEWFPEKLRTLYPEWSEDKIQEEVNQYWAKGAETVDPLSPPPHTTGAALDLTLKRIGGEHLWMGTIFDDVTKEAHTDFLEKETGEFSFTEQEARLNRRLLYWTMKNAGFENNPTEWWHFSYGDQMWGTFRNEPARYSTPS